MQIQSPMRRLPSVRGASIFSLLLRSPEPLVSSAAHQQQRCAFQGIFSVHIGAGCSLPLPSPLLIYRCDGPSRTSGSRHATQPSRPKHACEPAPWCYQNFTCPPSSCCRCSRQKINEAVTDGAGSGSCVARRGRFKRLRARKWEPLLSDRSGRFPSTCIELAFLGGWRTQECAGLFIDELASNNKTPTAHPINNR